MASEKQKVIKKIIDDCGGIHEVCYRFKVGNSTIRAWYSRGKIPEHWILGLAYLSQGKYTEERIRKLLNQ